MIEKLDICLPLLKNIKHSTYRLMIKTKIIIKEKRTERFSFHLLDFKNGVTTKVCAISRY